ncbi:hypothetical protein WN943_010130 [Citrus x changshan-huyou]
MYGSFFASTKWNGIKGLWPIRFSTYNAFNSILVISFVKSSIVVTMTNEVELCQTEIERFCSAESTLFCQNATHDQFLQVLLATGDGYLYYLEFGDGTLTEKVQTKLANHISCLDVSPTGEYPDYCHGAAVGLWNGSVMILSLPELAPISKQNLGTGDWTAAINSVLMCDLQGFMIRLASPSSHLRTVLAVAAIRESLRLLPLYQHLEKLPCKEGCWYSLLEAQKETTGAVYSLNAFNASNVHLLQHEEAAIRQQACDENAKWISAVAILDEGVYLGFENNFNLFIDRFFNDEEWMASAKEFIDGNLIESFVDLSSTLMQEISVAVDVSVE